MALFEVLLLQAVASESAASARAAPASRGRDMDRTGRIIVELLPSDWLHLAAQVHGGSIATLSSDPAIGDRLLDNHPNGIR